MGHIITGLDSPDQPDTRRNNEAICDQVGVYLYRLALRIAAHKAEARFNQAAEEI